MPSRWRWSRAGAGPRLFVSGRALSQTGGHGDGRPRSDFMPGDSPCPCCVGGRAGARVADGVDEVRRAVRQELQMGADQIKIMASGGVASPTDPVGAWGYSEEDAIVAEARARQTYVLAHAYTAEAISRAVRCGVRTIEHGNLVDAEAARAMMARAGRYVVPTLITYEALANEGADLACRPTAWPRWRRCATPACIRWRSIATRACRWASAPTCWARRTACKANSACAPRPRAGRDRQRHAGGRAGAGYGGQALGVIAPGACADMLVVDGNPLRDVSCLLGQGEHIPLVMQNGVQFDELAA